MSFSGRIFLLKIFFVLCWFEITAQVTITGIADSNFIYLADPTIFSYKKNYYLYGTGEGATNNGFVVFSSADLKSWKRSGQDSGYALRKGQSFGTSGFWAPQVLYYGRKFYMAYVANEQIAIAESDSPLGPFKQTVINALQSAVKQIDPFIFIDNDGKKYLYHVRLTNGNKIFVAEMEDDLQSIKPETVRECISATEYWENTANASWPVTEGPSVLKYRGVYYLFYTANDFRNPDYATGYATSNSPVGPWKKFKGNPILEKSSIGVNGTGHGDFVNAQNKLFYVFHTHYNNSRVAPRRTAIVEMNWKGEGQTIALEAKNGSFKFLRK